MYTGMCAEHTLVGWVFPVRRGRIMDCQHVDASTNARCSNVATRVAYTWDRPYGIDYELDEGLAGFGPGLLARDEFYTVIACDEHDPNPARSKALSIWFDAA